MKSDSDYLWDRTGEPDLEIQQLEEVLGALRYQPRPLEIPADIQVGRERSFFREFGPRLAIAATIAMLLFGLGIWLGLQRLHRSQPQVAGKPQMPAADSSPAAVPSPSENLNPKLAVLAPESGQKSTAPRHRVNQPVIARNSNRLRDSQLAATEREGRAAKDQLMLALRVASAKLNFAQKKTQDINSREMIHNQHKIG
jgi:hypothetical protein